MLTENTHFANKRFGFFVFPWRPLPGPGLVKDQTFSGFYLHPSQRDLADNDTLKWFVSGGPPEEISLSLPYNFTYLQGLILDLIFHKLSFWVSVLVAEGPYFIQICVQ